MPRPFDRLRARLLHAGVSPRHARRYLRELGDHLDDIVADERQRGLPLDVSSARARLGSDDALAEAMLARREFRAWSAKAPFTSYLLAPCATLVALTTIAMAVIALTCTWLRRKAGTSILPPWTTDLTHGVVVLTDAALPVLLSWILACVAFRRRSTSVWPVSGISALAILGAALQVKVLLPSAHAPGEIDLASLDGFAARLIRNLVLTVTPYAALTIWRLTQERLDGGDFRSRLNKGDAHDR